MPEHLRNIGTTATGVLYREQLSWGARLAMACVGLGAAMIAYFGYQLADWHRWSLWAMVMALVVAVSGCGAVAALLTAFGGTKSIRFDASSRLAVYDVQGPLYRRHREIGFRRIQRFDIAMRTSAGFGSYPVLLMRIHGRRRPVELREIGEREEAEDWRMLLQRMVRTH